MPIVSISLFDGRTKEQKHKLHKKVTEAIVEALGVAEARLTVVATPTGLDVAVAQVVAEAHEGTIDSAIAKWAKEGLDRDRLEVFEVATGAAPNDFVAFT